MRKVSKILIFGLTCAALSIKEEDNSENDDRNTPSNRENGDSQPRGVDIADDYPMRQRGVDIADDYPMRQRGEDVAGNNHGQRGEDVAGNNHGQRGEDVAGNRRGQQESSPSILSTSFTLNPDIDDGSNRDRHPEDSNQTNTSSNGDNSKR